MSIKSARWINICAMIAIVFASRAIAGSEHGANSRTVQWNSGSTDLFERMSREKIAVELERLRTRIPGASHVLVHLDHVPTRHERERLERSGLSLLSPVGRASYFATIEQDADADTLSRSLVFHVSALSEDQKLHADLADGIYRPWMFSELDIRWSPKLKALTDTGMVTKRQLLDEKIDPRVAVVVMFHRDTDYAVEAKRLAADLHCKVASKIGSVNSVVLHLRASLLDALVVDDAVMWVEPPLPALTDLNNSNRIITGVDTLNDLPYGLNGTGVNVLVYDGGQIYPHDAFGSRVTIGQSDTDTMSNHATHVAGTIGGDGAWSTNNEHRGMAPGVEITSYGFQVASGALQPGFLYTDPGDIEVDYTEAIGLYGVDIANNSIGTNVAPNGYPCEWTGNYGITSALIDSIVHGSLGESFRIVWANGNERNKPRCDGDDFGNHGEYYSTAPPACAKNHITVGAVNSDTDSMTSFSSWGPTDDGRLKPDICAPGCEEGDDGAVTSTVSGNSYSIACGTSMAAPTTTGVLALVLQQYRVTFSDRDDPLNATLKSLLANTAVDLGNVGPDYSFGYGSIRGVNAVETVMAGNVLEGSVVQGDTYRFEVVIGPNDTELRVTMAWDDVYAVPNTSPSLVNDLDLRVVAPGGAVFLPWTLDPGDPSAPAVRTVRDSLNNIEQVVIDVVTPGTYVVEVKGNNIASGDTQTFGATTNGMLVDCSSVGKVAFDRSVGGCSGSASVRVIDCDLNSSDTVVDTVQVAVTSNTGAGAHVLSLVESTPVSGSFLGSFTYSDSVGSDLLVSHGDQIAVQYLDPDDGSGASILRSATMDIDCTPPTFIVTEVSDLWYDHATVETLTDEPSECLVLYGTSIGSLNDSVLAHARSTLQAMYLPDLTEETGYVYAIQMTDAAGNVSYDDNGGAGYAFTTINGPRPIHEFLVDDTDPGWSTTADWEFGQPQGNGGDPSSGYTGLNVYGYNLDGYFPWHMEEEYLTTPPLDCTGVYEIRLEFQRWLGMVPDIYNDARIHARVGGGEWELIWEFSGGRQSPDEWTFISYLIDDIANNAPDLQIRWTMGPSEIHITECGWNLDDIVITGVTPPLSPPVCDGDANSDSAIDVNDISYVLFRLGGIGLPGSTDGDANSDGVVDVNDISYVLFRIGDTCP